MNKIRVMCVLGGTVIIGMAIAFSEYGVAPDNIDVASILNDQKPVILSVSDEGSEKQIPMPKPVGAHSNYSRQGVKVLWRPSDSDEIDEIDGIPVIKLHADTTALKELHVGQQFSMVVPELNRTFQTNIQSTHNQLNDIQVWNGDITGGDSADNVIITRGKVETYVMLSTLEGAYTVRINNVTGEAVMTSETQANPGLGHHHDMVIPDQSVPPVPVSMD